MGRINFGLLMATGSTGPAGSTGLAKFLVAYTEVIATRHLGIPICPICPDWKLGCPNFLVLARKS